MPMYTDNVPTDTSHFLEKAFKRVAKLECLSWEQQPAKINILFRRERQIWNVGVNNMYRLRN